jgi:hypothetical protein
LKNLIIAKVITALLFFTGLAQAQTLMGSAASMEKQYQLARSYGFNFVNTASEVQRNINSSQLVRVNPDRYLALHDVSYPYAVSETKLFLDRLSAQYYSACGEKLTVTSLLRPRNRQPSNASVRSVHPTGMAVDLRIPPKQKIPSFPWRRNGYWMSRVNATRHTTMLQCTPSTMKPGWRRYTVPTLGSR